MSSEAEIDSFDYQATGVNFTPAPAGMEEALAWMETIYSSCKWRVREDFATVAHIREVAEYVRRELGEKSPGAIYLRQNLPTNADVFEKIGLVGVIAQVEDRIKDLLTQDPRYASDPVRLFIKREAHKKAKADEKRWRIIWGVSLIDQIIDRLLYEPVLAAEVANCADIPSKPGYSFKYGGVDRMVRKYENGSKEWVSFDAKSFDITAPEWALRASRSLTERLCLTTDPALLLRWKVLSDAREEAALYGSFCFSNGVVCRKVRPCIQPSGRLTTISTNCRIVVLVRYCYDMSKGVIPTANEIIAMGDDTVQDKLEDPEEFVQWVQEVCGITFTVESETGLFKDQNFCSMKMIQTPNGVFVPVPLNWLKNAYALCHPEAKIAKDPERLRENRASCLQSLCCEYVYSEHFAELHGMLARYAPEKFRSREWFQRIITGWEGASSSSDEPDLLPSSCYLTC